VPRRTPAAAVPTLITTRDRGVHAHLPQRTDCKAAGPWSGCGRARARRSRCRRHRQAGLVTFTTPSTPREDAGAGRIGLEVEAQDVPLPVEQGDGAPGGAPAAG